MPELTPPVPTLRIEHLHATFPSDVTDPTGTTVKEGEEPEGHSRLEIHTVSINRLFDAQDHAEIEVYRDEFDALVDEGYTPTVDEFYIELDGTDVFGGRLVDVTRGGTTVKLILGDWETDLRQGEPSPGAHTFVNAIDLDIVEDAIERVETVTRGRLQSVDPAVSLLYSHASPAKMLHALREVTGGEYRINADKTLDYVPRIGRDHVDIVGPRNQTISNEFALEEKVQESPTHLRVLGAGEGDHQLSIDVVSNDYDGAGFGRPIWETIVNKEATTEEHLRALGEQYMSEYEGSPEYIEVTAEIYGLEVGLGDTFPVIYEDENIDTRLRVVENEMTLDEQGIYYAVTLSNRMFTRRGIDEGVRQDVDRYNLAFEGNAVPYSDGGGRQPVDAENNYEMDVDYPADVVQELDATLKIDGMAYRSYSKGSAGGGGKIVSETSASNEDFETVVESERQQILHKNVREDWETVSYVNVKEDTALLFVDFTATQTPPASYDGHPDYTRDDRVTSGRRYRARLYNKSKEEYHPSFRGETVYMYPDDSASALFFDAKNLNGDRLDLQLQYVGSSGPFPLITTYTTWIAAGRHQHSIGFNIDPHTHEPEPGIVEYDYYPSNCKVLVNGQEVDHEPVGDGEGPFDAEIDIGGYLNSGFNSIQVTSESLGHVRATCSLDLYRQITANS